MKTKTLNLITLLPLAGFVILLAMGVQSQQSTGFQQNTVRDSTEVLAGLKLPDSTQIKLVERSKKLNKLDSLIALDSTLKASNEKAIIAVRKKKERYEQYRKTPKVKPIPTANAALTVNAPALPDSSINLKKKTKRSVMEKVRDFINKP